MPGNLPARLGDVAWVRSGDKGNHVNLGVIALAAADYPRLVRWLTAERIAAWLAGLGASRVERFELPNLLALNFLVHDCLDGGASQSLRTDTQGKLLGTWLMDRELPPDF